MRINGGLGWNRLRNLIEADRLQDPRYQTYRNTCPDCIDLLTLDMS